MNSLMGTLRLRLHSSAGFPEASPIMSMWKEARVFSEEEIIHGTWNVFNEDIGINEFSQGGKETVTGNGQKPFEREYDYD